MSDGGYIRAWRSLFHRHDFLAPSQRHPAGKTEAWMDLVQMATHQPHRGLERGQIRVSVRYLSVRWKWKKSTVWDFVDRLRKADMIRAVRSDSRGTVYSIVRYDEYQAPVDASRTPNKQASRTRTGQQPDKNKEQITENKKRASAKKGAFAPVSTTTNADPDRPVTNSPTRLHIALSAFDPEGLN